MKRLGYSERQEALRTLGFKTYGAYLKSSLWRSIRAAVFATKGTTCSLCVAEGGQVHHLRYHMAEMSGHDTTQLVVICRHCHVQIEFDENGNKRKFSKVREEYWRRLSAISRPGAAFIDALIQQPNTHPTAQGDGRGESTAAQPSDEGTRRAKPVRLAAFPAQVTRNNASAGKGRTAHTDKAQRREAKRMRRAARKRAAFAEARRVSIATAKAEARRLG